MLVLIVQKNCKGPYMQLKPLQTRNRWCIIPNLNPYPNRIIICKICITPAPSHVPQTFAPLFKFIRIKPHCFQSSCIAGFFYISCVVCFIVLSQQRPSWDIMLFLLPFTVIISYFLTLIFSPHIHRTQIKSHTLFVQYCLNDLNGFYRV